MAAETTSEVAKSTVTGLVASIFSLSVTLNTRLVFPEFPSSLDTSLMEKVAPSSLVIVPIPVFPAPGMVIFLPVAPVMALNTTLKFSLDSTLVSPITLMVTVFVPLLTASASVKVMEPLAPLKSLVEFAAAGAVPFWVK